jgi:hypothetical protein
MNKVETYASRLSGGLIQLRSEVDTISILPIL